MYIDTMHYIIYGRDGSASYNINDCGGVELTDINGVITDEELAQAQKELA